jgi:hypothetical protein
MGGAVESTGDDLNALAIDFHRQDFRSCVSDADFHALAGVRVNQQDRIVSISNLIC